MQALASELGLALDDLTSSSLRVLGVAYTGEYGREIEAASSSSASAMRRRRPWDAAFLADPARSRAAIACACACPET